MIKIDKKRYFSDFIGRNWQGDYAAETTIKYNNKKEGDNHENLAFWNRK